MVLFFGAEWGFFPQTYGLCFAAGLGVLFPGLLMYWLRESSFKIRHIFHILPLSLCTAGLLLTYNEPFPIFVVAIGLFIFISWCCVLEKTKRFLSFLTIYLVETLMLINYESIRILKNLYQTLSISHGSGDIGWPVLWYPIQLIAFAFGLKSPFSHHFISLDSFISIILTPCLLVLMLVILIQWAKAHPKSRKPLLYLCCIFRWQMTQNIAIVTIITRNFSII